MIKQTVTATLALTLLAACQSQEQNLAIDDTSNSAANMADVGAPPADSEGGNEANSGAAAGGGVAGADTIPTVPAQFVGRWGMNANDCDPTKADSAKGLLSIDPMTLRFYEALATLKEKKSADASSFSGNFTFVGEGLKWEKVETLTVSGDTLKRTDKDGSFTYKRCA